MWEKAEKFLRKDKYLGSVVVKYGPCKIEKRPKSKYFESLASAIIGQQLSVKAAATIYGRFKTKLKGKVTPETILKTRKSSLRSCGLSNQKCGYIKDLAKHVVSGELEISRLDDLTDEKVMEELVAVKGMGKWTAEMFLMFTLSRPDIFPVDDLGIKNGMKKLLKKKKIADSTMEKFALKNWSPYRTAASWYVWANLDNS